MYIDVKKRKRKEKRVESMEKGQEIKLEISFAA
jgi:hypothetical protein